MENIGYIIDKLLRIHVYNSMVIHRISYQPFGQPGPDGEMLYVILVSEYLSHYCTW